MTDPSRPGDARRTVVERACDAVADAVRFFTRLPAPQAWGAAEAARRNDGVAIAAPAAGALVGLGAAAALTASLAIGLPALPAASFAAAAAPLLSGALHLDGLADVADGFGGGKTREAKLAIMRDSRLGSYGGVALALALLIRASLVAALVERTGADGAALGLIAAAALARPLAFLPATVLPPARPDGLGRSANPRKGAVVVGAALGVAAAILLGGAAAGLAAAALACGAAAAVSAIAHRQIGGQTGDVCGAAAEAAEIAALAGLVAAAAFA
ncbi:adenosylcobinamide-GDP ribazoletransferase [Hansschlegelia zhihuaiae]|uniref:Adenosylcobinamide-GDP ribazoletransferase n=1 Tax=Hansschlegelia zhihuaiae TaxID=405005 RepID=A0A4Q0MNE6_9HYPH|nr:adenosylcobinamide-GDP ribazoletransferase [Hansschlegelia zhihuaiae]RXF75391.1 adenosylcobinamide-GDP ribazoletransferase [Hansschlegelia zhihuaiae]